MKTNVPVKYASVVTHEGGKAQRESALKELRRTLSTCMLFENTFYESGDEIANRLVEQAKQVSPSELIAEIRRAKDELFLRHAPLWMAVQLTRLHRGAAVGDTIEAVVKRADELAEFVSLYWKVNGKKAPLTKQMKRGLAMAFGKFNEYQFSKYDREGEVKLRDVMFLVHPKPTAQRIALYKAIAEDTLPPADTWEVALSNAHTTDEKREVWNRLLNENKLGSLALIRNLRNMEQVGVSRDLVVASLKNAKVAGILPFQLVTAWRNAPAYAKAIDDMAQRALTSAKRLPGKTILLIDISGSMNDKLSGKSEVMREDAAGALAAHIIGVCDDVRIFVFNQSVKEVPHVPGLGMADALRKMVSGGTYLAEAVARLNTLTKGYDRFIVITDEQAHDGGVISTQAKRHYMVNVAPYKYGVEADKVWTKINGFSPAIVDWIIEEENDPLFDR